MGFRNRIVRISQLVADTITGATISTAASGARWVLGTAGSANMIEGFTGAGAEQFPGQIVVDSPNPDQGRLVIASPTMADGNFAALFLGADATKEQAIFDCEDGVLISPASYALRGLFVGGALVHVPGTTQAQVAVPHGLGGAPVRAAATVRGTSVYFATVMSIDATDVTVSVREWNGIAATVDVAVDVVAFR